jgi:hypothetical protein
VAVFARRFLLSEFYLNHVDAKQLPTTARVDKSGIVEIPLCFLTCVLVVFYFGPNANRLHWVPGEAHRATPTGMDGMEDAASQKLTNQTVKEKILVKGMDPTSNPVDSPSHHPSSAPSCPPPPRCCPSANPSTPDRAPARS